MSDKDKAFAKLDALQQKLGCRLHDAALLRQALTHRSFSSEHNERLEFLGDSILNLAVADLLFRSLRQQAEGDLSRIRANLVRQETLHELALGLGLSDLLRLGEGELKTGGAKRPSILADALEAVIGAVYLDQGFEVAKALVLGLFQDFEITPKMQAANKDPKTHLQELLQGARLDLPSYQVLSVTGAAHQQVFEVECMVVDAQAQQRRARGYGSSRRNAEQEAAEKMLQSLEAK